MKAVLFTNHMNLAATAYVNDMLIYVRPDYDLFDATALFAEHIEPSLRRLRC